MEETIRGIGVGAPHDGVGKIGEGGMGLVLFKETTRNFTLLVATEKKGLVGAGLSVSVVEVLDDFGGGF